MTGAVVRRHATCGGGGHLVRAHRCARLGLSAVRGWPRPSLAGVGESRPGAWSRRHKSAREARLAASGPGEGPVVSVPHRATPIPARPGAKRNGSGGGRPTQGTPAMRPLTRVVTGLGPRPTPGKSGQAGPPARRRSSEEARVRRAPRAPLDEEEDLAVGGARA